MPFLQLLYRAYSDLYFTYLEINPLGEYIAKRQPRFPTINDRVYSDQCNLHPLSLSVYCSSLLVITGGVVYMLDLAARLDSTAEFVCKVHWGDIDFPPPFGREALQEVGTVGLQNGHKHGDTVDLLWCLLVLEQLSHMTPTHMTVACGKLWIHT